jgi:hypothetical protein
MEKPEFREGDFVTYTSAFLRSVQWYVMVPKEGRVESVEDEIATVRWNDGQVSRINVHNLIHTNRLHLEPR